MEFNESFDFKKIQMPILVIYERYIDRIINATATAPITARLRPNFLKALASSSSSIAMFLPLT